MLLSELLDIIDNSRESEERVAIMNHNGEQEAIAMICSTIWAGIEDRTVNGIQARNSIIEIWLDD